MLFPCSAQPTRNTHRVKCNSVVRLHHELLQANCYIAAHHVHVKRYLILLYTFGLECWRGINYIGILIDRLVLLCLLLEMLLLVAVVVGYDDEGDTADSVLVFPATTH